MAFDEQTWAGDTGSGASLHAGAALTRAQTASSLFMLVHPNWIGWILEELARAGLLLQAASMWREPSYSSARPNRIARPAAILSAISLAILSAALLLALSNVLLMRRSQSAIATYVDSVSRIDGNHGGTFLHPRFAFRPARGQPMQKVVSTAGSTNEAYAVGDTVRVYYQAAHPERATLATFGDMWIGPILLAVVGLFLLCLAAPMVIFARRVARGGCEPPEALDRRCS